MLHTPIPDHDPREANLPKWAQDLIRRTRRAAEDRLNALAVARHEADATEAVLNPDGDKLGLGRKPEVLFKAPTGVHFYVEISRDVPDTLMVRVDDNRRAGGFRAARVVMGGASNVVQIEA